MTPQLNSYSGQTANLVDSDERLESIANEYTELLEQGHSISPESFVARFPDQGVHLLELLKSIRWIQLAARDLDDVAVKSTDNSTALPAFNINGEQPALLGDFRLIREVGRGGMGIVYEAEQISLSRRVAVKILPPSGLLNERHVARFAMESQAAAQLKHPNIVPIFAVGCEAGIYFYSMQLIEGKTPDGVMPLQVVAELGACVADALEHAHELGIIHRDIKPSNLLVDATGKVWVTDFGLARCRQSDQATASGAVLGTLRYMSPEQASGATTVDHRTDIYSLGVTLYELLVGRCPYDASNRSAFLVEINRGEPVALRHLNPSIPVDLETIVHKALSSDPQSRYATASDMADDLNRFIRGEVILARRPSFLDRLTKWVSRNRQWVTAAALMWTVVSIGAVFASMMLFKAERENRKVIVQTQKSLEEADAFFAQAREVVDHFGITLSRQLASLPGAESTRREVLQDTLRYYRHFMNQAERNPLRQRDVALTYMKLGRVAEQMEAFEEALESYGRSELLWQKIAPNDAERALCANLRGLLLTKMGKPELADVAFKTSVDCSERIFKVEPTNLEARRRYALALTNQYVSRTVHVDPEFELQSLQTALALQQTLLTNDQIEGPKKLELLVDTGRTYGALAGYFRARDPAKARSLSLQCIESFETATQCEIQTNTRPLIECELTKEEASDDLILALCNHAAILNDTDEVSLATTFALRATELGSHLCQVNPRPERSVNLAAAYNMLARLYAGQNQPRQQLEAFQKARNVLLSLVQSHETVADYRVDLAAATYNLAKTAESLSASGVATAAKTELLTQYQWLREHAPARVGKVTEFVDKLQIQSGNL